MKVNPINDSRGNRAAPASSSLNEKSEADLVKLGENYFLLLYIIHRPETAVEK